MILHIYALKDKELNCFLNPYYTDTTPDNSVSHMTRFLAKGDFDKAIAYKHRELYYLGTFDDEKGIIDAKGSAEYLLDCDAIINRREVVAKKDVREEVE